ncbi:MAG: hypothetical protein CBB87_08055 [Micavibrio sp. TMED27]|nr:hypothetical protein [Micavibrio sp.]OUT90624.1 MAG: hypothetical protein CBB87_08055 [Micavibrio sp. TMED27]|tara:strand:- start:1034 stop:1453 length:420 start_codon:yes stop_codon:yes gene_type:complete
MYATKVEMLQRYQENELIQLTDNIEPYTYQINDDVLNTALADATAEINLHVSGRYKLPLNPTPDALENICCVIAFYKLNRRGNTDAERQDYEDALKFLRSIAEGKTLLDQGGQEPKSAAANVDYDDSERFFSRNSLKGF